jgi:hypothetical protein
MSNTCTLQLSVMYDQMSSVSDARAVLLLDDDIICSIRIAYVIASVVWILIVAILGLCMNTCIAGLIVLAPLILFAWDFMSCSTLTRETEESVVSLGWIGIGLLVLIPICTWIREEDLLMCVPCLFLGMALVLVSSFEVCVGYRWLSVVRHIKSAVQTMSIALILYALYMSYACSRAYGVGSCCS